MIAYVWDHFHKPNPFTPDVVISIDEAAERKMEAMHCHTSQVYEWLPYNREEDSALPEDEALSIVCARRFFSHLRLGPRARSTVKDLKRHLAETRARGYAIAVEEAEPGIVALAATFRTDARPDAPVAGTLSVAGPISRITPERYADIHAALAAAVAELEGVWRLRTRQRGHARGYGARTDLRMVPADDAARRSAKAAEANA